MDFAQAEKIKTRNNCFPKESKTHLRTAFLLRA
jgi:hypothetical protein